MNTQSTKKTPEELHTLIYEQYDVKALIEYLNSGQTTKEDTQNVLKAFRFIENNISKVNKQYHQEFYDEYIRMIHVAIKNGALENNIQNRKLSEQIIASAFALKKTFRNTIYASRIYRKFYKERIEGYCDIEDKIKTLLNEANSLGSKSASSELETFNQEMDDIASAKAHQQKISEYKNLNLEYYNADCNLENFINTFYQKINKNTFSILIYGPENSGMKEFGSKLFTVLGKSFKPITAADIINRSDIGKCIKEEMSGKIAKLNNFIIHNVDSCFQCYNRFEDDKDFILERNTQALIKLIDEKKCSLILIVNDIEKTLPELQDAFAFKIKFDYMNNLQKRKALKHVFHFDDEKIEKIDGLLFEDFLRVKEKISILNANHNNEDILKMLKKEADIKPDFLTYNAPIANFDMNLVNADTDLAKLTLRLERSTLPFTMLIHGPAGTGKSYYLRYLAHKMGIKVIEKTAAELFSTYQGQPALNILNMFKEAEKQNAMIIMDEIEQITIDRSKNSKSENWRADMVNAFLTCLENTSVPFVGTTNFIKDIDKAILRRLLFKIKFDYLSPKQIAYAFYLNFNQYPPVEILKLGGLTNGDFTVVKKKAQILDVMYDKQELFDMLKEEASAKACIKVNYLDQEIHYDKNFINIEGNALELYTKKLKENKVNNFSILLYGPSGTGKSLYLRHLAKELGFDIIEIKVSDILSKWFGESENNLAKAFEEAKNHRAMLIFDEIDSLLGNKENGLQQNHVQVVNEFLLQLENHPYPVCATTNYLEHIEPAAIRRFKINAKVDYLRKDQYDYVYRKTFGVEPVKDIKVLEQLTPAIFALAAEKVALEDVSGNENRIFEIFMEEAKRFNAKNALEKEDKTYEKLLIAQIPLYTTPISENYDKVLTGFVKIITENGHGSGFFITSDGFILTNQHVVHDFTNVVVELFSGRHVPGEVIRTNSLDVALIKISAENKVCPMPIRTSELNVGETAFSLGNPKSHNQVLSKGCITRYTNLNNAQRIETDCFMDNGSSGGPLFDEFGNVIGINVEGWTKTSANVKLNLGLNLHLSINDALSILNIKLEQ